MRDSILNSTETEARIILVRKQISDSFKTIRKDDSIYAYKLSIRLGITFGVLIYFAIMGFAKHPYITSFYWGALISLTPLFYFIFKKAIHFLKK